jgi:hypothetical protein
MNKLVYREYQEKMSQDHNKLEKEEDINLSFPYILSLSFCLTMHTCWSSVLVCWTWTQTELDNSSICNQKSDKTLHLISRAYQRLKSWRRSIQKCIMWEMWGKLKGWLSLRRLI